MRFVIVVGEIELPHALCHVAFMEHQVLLHFLSFGSMQETCMYGKLHGTLMPAFAVYFFSFSHVLVFAEPASTWIY